ncbi:unnamed protein product [Cylicocyclus nassatus]|uniref:5'-nucleotidase domain-containing protein 3 n=1 Tax=Cylicocyclus nassatus TaxID=53992 RepID=A0AA36MB62_CYLNA|nr:unnamed protein product [Cylicocyclus nassatus]
MSLLLRRIPLVFHVATASKSSQAQSLIRIYESAREACAKFSPAPRVDPRAVFVNNELDLGRIDVYGFDYDYTLAVYTRDINELIYKLALRRLISQFKYPSGLLELPYDREFAIRGLHFDVQSSCLLKVDAFSQIQAGAVYRGRRKLSVAEVKNLFPGLCLPDLEARQMPQLVDLFSLPWAGLLSTVVHYCDAHNIVYDPKCLYDDSAECVQQVHISGELYQKVGENLESYIHPNEGLKEYLELLNSAGKELFVVTNSPYKFINVGMTYMLGPEWRKYFEYIVVSAKKPTFFHGREPFRLYDPEADVIRFEKVNRLEEGSVYCRGNIDELSSRAGFKGKGVLYFGDHIYTDLADPILRLGWRTAAVVPELAREIRTQNNDAYRRSIQWLEVLTTIIEEYQANAQDDPDSAELMEDWRKERADLRDYVKSLFNPQFGSLFRTFHNMTHFSRRLNRLSDVYTSRVPNMLKYSLNHCFFPRRNALPHENLHSVPVNADHMVDIVKQKEQIRHDTPPAASVPA